MKILIAILFSAVAAAQTVTVAGSVVDATGGNAVGSVTVSWPNFTYGGTPIMAGSTTKRPSAGSVSFTVYPGTYTVTYRLTNGTTTTVKWIVPASPSSTTIAAVQTSFVAPNVTSPIPIAQGGTGVSSLTASKCVQVNSDGDGLEASEDACGTSSVAASIETGTSYTVVAADKGKAIFFTASGAVAVTMPAASVITGSVILVSKGAGGVNVSGGFTVSLLNTEYVWLISDGTTWRNVNRVLRAGLGQSSSSSGAVTSFNLDALLQAVNSLAGNGLIAQTGATTVANRTITGTANEVCVTNGDGASGNPTAAICATFDVSGKTSTKPMKSGTSAPGTCAVGEMFFDTDATAGQNLYGCTATNTWTLQAGGGDALTANPLSQFASTTSAQVAGVVSNETGSSLLVFNTNATLVTPLIQNYTVAGLPAAGTAGRIALVSDSSDGTCTAGSGSTWVWCRDTGSAWTAISGGGGGGTTYLAGDGITITGGDTINADNAVDNQPIPNDGSTGTTQYYAVIQNSSGNGVKAATTDLTKVLGVCASGCGTTGNATVVQRGLATLHSDGAITINQYVVISTSLAGAFASTATCPTDKQVFGIWAETQGSAGDWGAVLQAGLCVPASSGGGTTGTPKNRSFMQDSFCSAEGATSPVSHGTWRYGAWVLDGSSSTIGEFDSTIMTPRFPCGLGIRSGATSGNRTAYTTGNQFFARLYRNMGSNMSANTQWERTYWVRLSSITNARYYMGWGMGNNIGATNTPSGDAIIVRFSTIGVSDSAFTLMTCNSSTCTPTASTVSISAGTTYQVSIYSVTAGTVCIKVNGETAQCTSSNVTNGGMNDILISETGENANKYLYLHEQAHALDVTSGERY